PPRIVLPPALSGAEGTEVPRLKRPSRIVIPPALSGAEGTEVPRFLQSPPNCHPACPERSRRDRSPALFAIPLYCHPDRSAAPYAARSGGIAAPLPSSHRIGTDPLLYPTLRSCYFQYSSPGVAELADAADSKSAGDHSPCGFDSLLR